MSNEHPRITSGHLERKAIIYVRQSTLSQLQQNHESRRRQYGLADYARDLGFRTVETIDEDLGRSGSGLVERPGFQRLVTLVCLGDVGAILCIEASRLARNGRDWHHLIELCGLAGTLVIDPDGVYDPRLMNDRLLLGLKGTMSEFELNLLRQRSLQAIVQKAQRGELQYCLPVGLSWSRSGKIELDADRRVQTAIQLVFSKFVEFGSARQVLLWLRQQRITLPRLESVGLDRAIVWALPIYSMIIKLLRNPLYAGAYAFGKTEARIKMLGGRASKTVGHQKPRERWIALIPEQHPGYLSWEQYVRNQATLAENAHMKRKMSRSAARGGHSLLAGLLRCGRCGRMLHVGYSGTNGTVPRYFCRGAHINHGAGRCISVGGLRVDQVVSAELLRVCEPHAVEAAIKAADTLMGQDAQRREALRLEVQQARYEVRLAERRYEAMDPENRLVAAELEVRWNAALQRAGALEADLEALALSARHVNIDRTQLVALADDLSAVWHEPTTDKRIKQRIARILLREVTLDVDDEKSEVKVMLHWIGGRHSSLRFPKNRSGHHRYATHADADAVIRSMAGRFPDDLIAATLNRLRLMTGHGHGWTEISVRSLRNDRGWLKYDPTQFDGSSLTLAETAQRVGLSPTAVRHMIEDGVLPATQAIAGAPWLIDVASLDNVRVVAAIKAIKDGKRRPRTQNENQKILDFIGV